MPTRADLHAASVERGRTIAVGSKSVRVVSVQSEGNRLILVLEDPTGTIPLDNPYIFVNPPTQVKSNGIYTPDMAKSLDAMVSGTVKHVAAKKGVRV